MSKAIQIIIGLGNPGPQYALTRHNAGAWLVENLASETAITLQAEKKFHGMTALTNINGESIRLFIPTCFMNLSGQAVQSILSFYKIMPENALISHDELDLPPGTVRLKESGGHGGHNGLRDIIQKLGTQKFPRLRIGIGHPGDKRLVHDYVLKQAPSKDQNLIEASIQNAQLVIPELIAGEWQSAINRLHSS